MLPHAMLCMQSYMCSTLCSEVAGVAAYPQVLFAATLLCQVQSKAALTIRYQNVEDQTLLYHNDVTLSSLLRYVICAGCAHLDIA